MITTTDERSGEINSTTTLALVRHGQTDWNAAGRLQGASDIPLNDVGRTQAAHAADALSHFEWDFIVSSPLARASETADIIAARLGLPEPSLEPALVERDYGPAEGLGEGDELDALRLEGGYRGAETEESVASRGTAVIENLVRENPGARIVVITHGTLIRVTLSQTMDQNLGSIDNAVLNLVRHHRPTGWTLDLLNGEPVNSVTDHGSD